MKIKAMGLYKDRRMFLGLMAGALALPLPAAAQMRDLVQGGRSGSSSNSLGGARPAARPASGPEPAAIVRQIFETYQRNGIPRVPYTPAMQKRLRAGPNEADEILSAQDTDVRSFNVREISRGADRAVVEVIFLSFGRKMCSQFDFRVVDGQWMVANYRILAGVEFPPHDLRKRLKLPPLN